MRYRILIIVGMALFFLCSVFGSPTGANSTSGAPMTMCMDCHGMPKGAEVRVENLPSSFQPGATYEMTVKVASAVKSEGDIQGGFAVSASAGELVVSDPKNTMKSDGYITHTAEGCLQRSWKFKWKAPATRSRLSSPTPARPAREPSPTCGFPSPAGGTWRSSTPSPMLSPASSTGPGRTWKRELSRPSGNTSTEGSCTGRLIEQWRTGSMTNRVPELKRAVARAYVEISSKLSEKLGVKDGEALIVESPRGRIELPAKVLDIRKATGGPREDFVFIPWFDEGKLVNMIMRDSFDPFSFQADYKMFVVKIYKGTTRHPQAEPKPVIA